MVGLLSQLAAVDWMFMSPESHVEALTPRGVVCGGGTFRSRWMSK